MNTYTHGTYPNIMQLWIASLGARVLCGRSRHTRSYSKNSCETGIYISRSLPAIHKNYLFLTMSVTRHMGPEIFLLLKGCGIFSLVGFGVFRGVEWGEGVQEGNWKAFLIQFFLSLCSSSLSYPMPVAAPKMAKEEDTDMFLSSPFLHISFCWKKCSLCYLFQKILSYFSRLRVWVFT